jgi:hypothetical protein
MTLGSTQPLTEMSTRNLKKRNLGVKCGHLLAGCLSNVGVLTSRNPMGLHGLEQGYLYLFPSTPTKVFLFLPQFSPLSTAE